MASVEPQSAKILPAKMPARILEVSASDTRAAYIV
jgi:hypothetical protein